MTYSIRIKPSAEKSLSRLPREIQRRIVRAITSLAEDPRPVSSKKLQTDENLYRIRVGDYRIIYAIRNAELVILVLALGHRRDVYR
jgi:mRNA interferase RelE/StbE